MANLIHSIGYAHGKLHTGLICYLIDLWNEGETEPFKSFCNSLRIPLPDHPLIPKRELHNIDLVVLDGERNPWLAIEMKVDDHEHIGKSGKHQTDHYPTLVNNCRFLFVTLGVGEFFRAPTNKTVRWVKLQEFYGAVASVTSDETPILDWKLALDYELELRRAALKNDYLREKEFRGGGWNLTVLGDLRERLEKREDIHQHVRKWMQVYPEGQAPDTILNFGWLNDPYFLEINSNGRLNLKVNKLTTSLASHSPDERKKWVEATVVEWKGRLANFSPLPGSGRSHGDSTTLLSFDVGLDGSGPLKHSGSVEETVERVTAVLKAFYSTKECADDPVLTAY